MLQDFGKHGKNTRSILCEHEYFSTRHTTLHKPILKSKPIKKCLLNSVNKQ